MEWIKEAACAGQPIDIFFPADLDEDDGTSKSFNERRAELARIKRAALKFCDSCKVVESCLQWAVENEEEGIWGGTTQRQRTRAVQETKRESDRNVVGMETHGTEIDYNRHLRLNTVPCAECRRAHARYVADRRRARAAATPSAG